MDTETRGTGMATPEHYEPLRILIVEDEDAHSELICRAFEEENGERYAVIVARRLKEARGFVDRSRPDLVIADLLLPDGKGTELVWNSGTDRRMPLIVMTSKGNEVAAVEAIKGGALDYVVKSDTAFLDMPRIADRALREWGHITQRRKAEEELRIHQVQLEMQNEQLRRTQIELEKSRDNYSELYDFAPVGYVTLDNGGLILEANLTATKLLGTKRSELLGKPFPRFVSTETADAYHLYLTRVLQTRTTDSCELQLVKRDGAHFHCRLESVAVQDSEGNFTRCRTILVDITDRKRAEEELKAQEAELKAIYENAPLIMFLVDEERRVCKVNGPATDFANRSAEEMLGLRGGEALRCLHSMDSSDGCGFGPYCDKCTVRCTVMNTFETGTSHHQVEARLPFAGRETPEELVFLLSTTKLNVTRQPMVLVSILDITARKKAEEALRESEHRFRAVFESADDCIAIMDHSLKYTHVNSAMCKLLGLRKSKIVGRGCEDLYGEETGSRLLELETRVLSGESIEVEQTRPVQGIPLTFHDTMVPLMNASGQIIGICCISRNVTERKKLAVGEGIIRMRYPSPAMRSTLEKALIAAERDSIVLLEGESGTGKDHLARWLHERSKRATGPFLAINCAALPRDLAESELFGHERGAFTGASGRKRGLLELAEAGTILLNEIGELELSLQAKLLTFLDTRSFVRVGGEKLLQVNARLMAATHRELETEVNEGRFLEPLFYRLSVFPIRVPPLRERTEDILILAEEIISKLALEMQLTEVPRLHPRHIQTLSQYAWPGNVRELRNVLERSLILWRGDEFDLAFPHGGHRDAEWSHNVRYLPGKTLREVTDAVAISLCVEVLRRCGDNKKETARLLDISRDTLYRYIRKMK